MITTILASLALSTVTMVAPVSDTGAWRLYEGNYLQTHEGRAMNRPRAEIVTGGLEPSPRIIEGGFTVKRVQPIINPQPIIGKELRWGKFEAVDGLRIIDCTIRFTRTENQGCGLNFRFSRNIRIERCTFLLEGGGETSSGGSGYGVVFSGCENVTVVNSKFYDVHAGVMITDGTKRASVWDTEVFGSWMAVSLHGGGVSNILLCRVRASGGHDRFHGGNVMLPDGAEGVSVIDCVGKVLEFSGKVRNAKVQGGAFETVLLNQYKARPGDSQADYSQAGIEVDGTTKVGKFVVKSL